MWFFISLIILISGLFLTKKLFNTLRSPVGLFTIVWMGLFTLSNLKLVNYYDVSTSAGILIISVYYLFFFGALVASKVKVGTNKNIDSPIKYEFRRKNLLVGLFFSIILSNTALVLWLIFLAREIGIGALLSSNMYLNRIVMSDISTIFSYLMYIPSISGSLLAGILIAKGEKFKLIYLTTFLPTIANAIFTGQRNLTIISILLFMMPLFLIKVRVKKKYLSKQQNMMILFLIVSLVVFFVVIGGKRGSYTDITIESKFSNPIFIKTYMYLTGSFVAFSEQLKMWNQELMYGVNSFLPVFKILNALGVTSYDGDTFSLIESGREFIPIPMSFNVYTFLWDVISDWGYLAIFIYPTILGFLSNLFWKKSNLHDYPSYSDILLSFIALFLSMSFIYSTSSMTTILYVFIYTSVIFLVFKNKIIFRKG